MNRIKEKLFCKILTSIGLLFVLGIIFWSCEETTNNGPEYNPNLQVKVASFYPDSGKIAEKVIFTGENFGSDPSIIKVYFNKKRGKVIGADGKNMYVVCPRMPGDTCTLAVVIGKDSLVLAKKFIYRMSVTVTTVTGNGQNDFKQGSLASAQIRARYLAVDGDDNIFAIQRSDGTDGLIRINEQENVVTLLHSGMRAPNALCIFKNGVITFPADEPVELFYNSNPAEGWAVRSRNLILPSAVDGGNGSAGRYKHAMAACEWDGKVYVRYRSGDIGKIDQETYQIEWIYRTPFGDCYGLAFHPHRPTHLYMAMLGEVQGGYGHSICMIDVSDPENTFRKLTGPMTSGAFRDGPLEQAQFDNPCQIYFDPDGYLYVADRNNHCIRRITPDNIVETVVGIPRVWGFRDGPKEDAQFNEPWGIGVKLDGTVYVADWNNARIRKLAIE